MATAGSKGHPAAPGADADHVYGAEVVVVLRPGLLEPVARFEVGLPVTDIGLADVDSDGRLEIVVVDAVDTSVYDAATLQLEWLAENRGGLQLGIGDLDGDGAPEIVVNGGSTAYVLDAVSHLLDYGWVGGFGDEMAVADLDEDGRQELVLGCGSLVEVAELNEAGTYGQGIPGRTRADALQPGTAGLLTQLHESASYRTNLCFLEVSGHGAEVDLRLFAANGSLLSTSSYSLRSFEAKQLNQVFGAGAELTGSFAEVTVRSGGAVLAYASIVDNRTGDPTYVEAQ